MKNSTTEDIIKEFREKYCYEEIDFNGEHIGWTIAEMDMNETEELEQFIKEALERVYKQGTIDAYVEFTRQELKKYNKIKKQESRAKLKANKLDCEEFKKDDRVKILQCDCTSWPLEHNGIIGDYEGITQGNNYYVNIIGGRCIAKRIIKANKPEEKEFFAPVILKRKNIIF